jgi:hypothetical protein
MSLNDKPTQVMDEQSDFIPTCSVRIESLKKPT